MYALHNYNTYSLCYITVLYKLISAVLHTFITVNPLIFTSTNSNGEILFGRKSDDENVDSYFVKKLNFTLLYAKYYLYNQKLLCNEISMIDFMANLNQKYSLEGLSM